MPPAAIVGGNAVLGGIAGAIGDKSSQSYTSGLNLSPASANELAGQQGMMSAFNDLQAFNKRGPGEQDVANAYGASTDLASMLKQMQETGGMPGGSDISQANGMAQNLFRAQRVGMQQNFTDQSQQADRQAALMGRAGNDPILRAKLAQEQTRQGALLDAQQGAFGQQLAMSLPGQRLQYAGQRAGVLGGLATQAMQNRQMIAAMGEGIMNNERNFRLATAQQYGTKTQESGGGWGGAIKGAMAGFGVGSSMATGGGMGGFGGGSPMQLSGMNNMAGGAGMMNYGGGGLSSLMMLG